LPDYKISHLKDRNLKKFITVRQELINVEGQKPYNCKLTEIYDTFRYITG